MNMREAHRGLVWGRLMRNARYDDTKTHLRFWIITMMLVLVGLYIEVALGSETLDERTWI